MITITRELKVNIIRDVRRSEQRLKNIYGIDIMLVPKIKGESLTPDRDKLIDTIFSVTCLHHGVTKEQIIKQCKERKYVTPRHRIAALLFMKVHKIGVKEVGVIIRRDHSTGTHARQTVADLCETDPIYRTDFEALELKIDAAIEELVK